MKKMISIVMWVFCFLVACQGKSLKGEKPIMPKEYLSSTPKPIVTNTMISTVTPFSVSPKNISPTPMVMEIWSLQGEIILGLETEIQFLAAERIIKVSLDGEKIYISPEGYSCTNPLLSPNKKKLLFQCNRVNNSVVNLYLYDLDSSKMSILVAPSLRNEDLIVYAWNADSSSVFLSRTRAFWIANINDENWTLPSQVFYLDLARQDSILLFGSEMTIGNIWWIKNQNKLLVQSANVDDKDKIYFPFTLVDLRGRKEILPIKNIPSQIASVSHQGDLIAFVSRDNNMDIVSTETGEQVAQVSPEEQFEFSDQDPIWSLNDKMVSYLVCSQTMSQPCNVILYNMETGERRLLSCKCAKMSWFNNENYFAYIQDKTLFIYSIRTNQSKKIFSDNLIWNIPILLDEK